MDHPSTVHLTCYLQRPTTLEPFRTATKSTSTHCVFYYNFQIRKIIMELMVWFQCAMWCKQLESALGFKGTRARSLVMISLKNVTWKSLDSLRELSFSKLDLPLFIGPFLSILHQNKVTVGGWDYNSTQIYFLSNHSIYHYVCSTRFCMIWNGLSCQEGTCVLTIVVRFVIMFPCNQIKLSQNPRCEA